MKLATLSDLKTRLGIVGDSEDAVLGELLDGVTAAIEAHLDRTLLTADGAALTETHDGGVTDILLRAWPIVAITSVTEALDGDFADEDPLVDGTDYRVASMARGVLRRRPYGLRWIDGADVVQVVYTAGYCEAGAVLAGFNTPPAKFQEAALLQAVYAYNRRKDPGASGVDLGGGGATQWAREYGLLESVKAMIAGERRVA